MDFLSQSRILIF